MQMHTFGENYVRGGGVFRQFIKKISVPKALEGVIQKICAESAKNIL
jgi:hypothetical protein